MENWPKEHQQQRKKITQFFFFFLKKIENFLGKYHEAKEEKLTRKRNHS